MRLVFLFFITFYSIAFSNSIDNLLQEYNASSEKSLKTVDEKLGHVFIYSQKEIQLMQYHKLNDILKELPLLNLNKNRFGQSTLSLAGTKTTVSGFFRFFINDHEISSIYDQSPSLTWGNLPLDFVDHIEIYYGESSLALGNDTGIYFIRLYTKTPSKENGTELNLTSTSKDSNSQSITDSRAFENGWAYLFYLNNTKTKDSDKYSNDENRKYLFLDISNENTNINFGYSDVKKNNYMGYAMDNSPENGEIKSKDFYLDITHYLLKDKSLKVKTSIDVNETKYSEENSSGMLLVPTLNLRNIGLSLPKKYNENLKLKKLNTYISKSYNYKNNNFLAAFNISKKEYEVKNRNAVNFINQNLNTNYNDYNNEQITSFIFQDDYKVNENLFLIANTKFDKYKRNGSLSNSSEKLHRVGVIYTPFKNFGLKSFYTKTYLPPTFYNIDFTDKNNQNIKTQKYDIFTIQGVYTTEKSKFSTTYHRTYIDDFIYSTPVGFINIDHTIKTSGFIYSYEYLFNKKNKLQVNYFTTKSSEKINSSDRGGYIKYVGEYDNFEYFTSLIYRNSYDYKGTEVKASYDFNLGTSYNYSKSLKFSLKGENLLNKGSKSLYDEGFAVGTFALEDTQRTISLSMKWVF
ncbi:MAG: TonB-dependent receptor [Arcobacter sp.]|nr:MAG: TonB-dependent receptor [Arcobacter sp.]